MIYNTNHYTIADLFKEGNNVRYVIPKFQREYIWAKENWEVMFDDMIEGNGEGNFIGSILCIKNEDAATLGMRDLEVVDGQQRLATISLLFCALYAIIKDRAANQFELVDETLRSLETRLAHTNKTAQARVVLSQQHENLADYGVLLSDLGLLKIGEEVKGRKARKIYKAYKYFLGRLEEYDMEGLKRIASWVDRILVVLIEVSSHADAFMLFEGLNDRGIPLSVGDLIKNKMFSELEQKGVDIDEAFRGWNLFLENVANRAVQERFLRQYYNVLHLVKGDVKVGMIDKATKANLVKIYETLIERDAKALLDELVSRSTIYRTLLKGNGSDPIFGTLAVELEALAEAKASSAYMVLLYLVIAGMNDPISYKKIIDALTRYFNKRNLTEYHEEKDIDLFLMELIRNIEADKVGRLNAEYIMGYLNHTIYLR